MKKFLGLVVLGLIVLSLTACNTNEYDEAYMQEKLIELKNEIDRVETETQARMYQLELENEQLEESNYELTLLLEERFNAISNHNDYFENWIQDYVDNDTIYDDQWIRDWVDGHVDNDTVYDDTYVLSRLDSADWNIEWLFNWTVNHADGNNMPHDTIDELLWAFIEWVELMTTP